MSSVLFSLVRHLTYWVNVETMEENEAWLKSLLMMMYANTLAVLVTFYCVCFSCLLHREPLLQNNCFSIEPRTFSYSHKLSLSIWPSISSPQQAGDPTAPCPRTKRSSCLCSTTTESRREKGRATSLWQLSRSSQLIVGKQLLLLLLPLLLLPRPAAKQTSSAQR